MYRDGEGMRLSDIQLMPKDVLDIGAHTGQFYKWAKSAWPYCNVFMIEANPLHQNTLLNLTANTKDEYMISALGDKEREVTFYTRSDKPHTEGNSYYKEANYWDIPQLVQEETVTLKKLDDIFDEEKVFDLVKMDTQGSELDILKGGKKLITKATAVILEVAYIEYNLGAPTSDEVIKHMNNIGFEEIMSIGEHYEGEEISQKDLLFLNKELK
jgi:FkbM family methyltransferase|tara:strand:+ start:162 stop:800 length:639 start_codon:yes stop_codon:yes gene_type:complete